MASIGKLDIDLRLLTQKFDAGMSRTNKKIDKFSRKMDKVSGILTKATLGFAGLAGAGGMLSLVKSTLAANDALAKTADKIGLTTQKLQEYRFAASQSAGVTEKSLDVAMQRFSRRMGEAVQGKGELIGILKQYGIAVVDSSGKTRNMNDVLADYADAIQNADSQQEKLRLAFKAFDTEGAALVNMMRNGSEGLKELGMQARDAGVVMDEKLLRSSEALNSAIDAWSDTVKTKMNVQLSKMTVAMGEFFGIINVNAETLTLADGSTVGLAKALDQAEAASRRFSKANKDERSEIRATTAERIRSTEVLLEEQKVLLANLKEKQDAANKAFKDQKERSTGFNRTGFGFDDQANDNFNKRINAQVDAQVSANKKIEKSLLRLNELKNNPGKLSGGSAGSSAGSAGGKPSGKVKAEKVEEDSALLITKLLRDKNKQLERERYLHENGAEAMFKYDLQQIEIGKNKEKLELLDVDRLASFKNQTAAMKQAAIDQEKSQNKINAVMEEGKRLYEQTRTPVERLNAEFERLNKLLEAKAVSQDTYNRAMAVAQDEFDELNRRVQEAADEFGRLDDAVLDWQDNFIDAALAGKDAFKDFAISMVRDWAAARLKMAAFGDDGKGGFFGGIFSSLFGGGGFDVGGNAGGASVELAGALAKGGAVSQGSSYLVGEKGAEIFTPNTSGRIIPNNKINNGSSSVGSNAAPIINLAVHTNSDKQGIEQKRNGDDSFDIDVYLDKRIDGVTAGNLLNPSSQTFKANKAVNSG